VLSGGVCLLSRHCKYRIPAEQKSQAEYLGISRGGIISPTMKNPKVKKPKKLTPAEQKIVDQAIERFADIAVQFIDEQNAAKRAQASEGSTKA